jgi:hypothetical protein
MFPSDGIETIYVWVDENSNHSHHDGDHNRDLNHRPHVSRVSTLGAWLSSGDRWKTPAKVQETLRNKGHYRSKVDGVFGLRTGAGIRAYQRAESLPVTGQLDTQTAGKFGVRPEDREETGYETASGKPSAYMNRAKRSGTSKTPRKAIKTVAAPERGRGDREKTLQPENDPQ